MNKTKLALIATIGVLVSACGSKTEVDFSIVPVKGSNEEYQYIDIAQKGKIVINPQFERAHIFRDGLALVRTSGREGKWGYIDKNGKFAIAPVYSKAQDFSEGMAWVQLEDQPPMLIDEKGKTLLQIDSLTAAYPFNKGIAGIKFYSQGQHGLTMFIDKKGNPVAATVAGEEAVPLMKDGLYVFQDKSTEKWGYRNKSGEVAINAQFDDIGLFIDGMTPVLSGTKLGAIDKKGNFIINPQYDSLLYDGKGLFLAKVGKKWGWVNKKGEITINPQFDLSMGFNGNKLAAVQMGKKWAYIDVKGQIIINPQFLLALPFNGDYAMVANEDGKVGFINSKGEYVVYPMYDIAENDIYEYLLASAQNASGLPMQYFVQYMGIKDFDYQDGNFSMYEKLKEKIEGDEQKAIAAAEEKRLRAIAAASGSFVDPRDNKRYKTIKIGTQTWMAENLNYNADGSKCYGNDSANCEKYGRLYNWAAATKACPSGWNLASREEWSELMEVAEGENVAGKTLRAKEGWNNDSNGADEYGFAALPGGQSNASGRFSSIGAFGYWWTATESGTYRAYTMNMDLNRERLRWDNDDKFSLASVRCVQSKANSGEAPANSQDGTAKETKEAKGEYKVVKIGTQTWTAENMNYNASGSVCYDNKPENCEKYGRLYNWAAAMKICQSGWHLPSDDEWQKLLDFAGDDVAGKKLKAKNGWSGGGNGTDEYGFSAPPGGYGESEGTFNAAGNFGVWWSSSEADTNSAYRRSMSFNYNNVRKLDLGKNYLISVRCVKDN